MTTSTLPCNETPTSQPSDLSGRVSVETIRLAACCASVPGLEPVAETLKQIHTSVEQVSWSKDRCRKLSINAILFVSIICEYYADERADTHELQIGQTVRVMREIYIDVRDWAALSLWNTWVLRHEVDERINKHEEHLKDLAEFLFLSATRQKDDRIAELQESLNTKPQGSADQKRAEEQELNFKVGPEGSANRKRAEEQQVDLPGLLSSETGLDVDRLTACCASVPGLPPVVTTLRQIYTSTERVSWNKGRCRKLSLKAKSLVFIICDHYDNERADTDELQFVVGKTIQNMRDIAADVTEWADLSLFRSWYARRDVDARIKQHEENLRQITEFLSLAATLQAHDKVAALQESLKTTANNSADRRKAEEQLYKIRSAPPGDAAELIPPELACECVRLGNQPEYSGSRNDIWKGRWLDKQDVALIFYKEYKVGMRDDDSIRRFERQIRVWRKLYHPYVLRLYGWCIFEGETYLVSPWLQNRDVVRYIDGNRNRHQKCLSLIYEVAQGLQYLHSEGIIHGSLKPSNILVQDNGSAVLSDFSLAKLATPDAKNTQTSPQVNVFRYQAPEVILDQPISEASDVYSWAMTALEIVTGDPPYHTWRSPGQLIAQVMTKNQIPRRADYKSPALEKHPEVWELFVRCWKREPKDRPTAKEIVEVLKKVPDVNVK